MLELVQILLLTVHLLAMNIAAGGPLIGIWLEWQALRGFSPAAKTAHYLAGWSVLALLLGGLVGVAIGWTLWSPAYQTLWTEQFAYKLKWGIIELVFSLVLAIVCWVWCQRRLAGGSVGSKTAAIFRALLMALNATNLLYHFPLLFLLAGKLREARDYVGPDLRGMAYLKRAAADGLPALAVHFALASVAVAGVWLMGYALRLARQNSEASLQEANSVALWGGRFALGATLFQLPVGLWVLLTSDSNLQSRLMGADPWATLCFFISLVAALWLMQLLAAVAMGETDRGSLLKAMIVLTMVVFLMTAAHHLARRRANPERIETGVKASVPILIN